jgi:hypothetical protein
MKHIKHINEGWLDTIKPKKNYRPTYEIIHNLVKNIIPKYILSSRIINKYTKSIKFEMYDNSDTGVKECWIIIESNIQYDLDNIRKTFRIFYKNNVVYCLDDNGFNVNYPLNSEEYLSEIIELFAFKMKPYVEKFFLEESGGLK